MTDLHQVRGNGCVLYFPDSFNHPELIRGGKGYVVDLDAPFEREWCARQEYKLEPAPAKAKPSPIVHPIARQKIAAWLAANPAEAAKLAAKPAPVVAPKADPLSDDDLDESKRAARKPAKAGVA